MPGQISTESTAQRIPKCLFPAFGPEPGADGDPQLRETDVSQLGGRWGAVEASFREKGISLPTLLRAAWALTLNCYVSSELTSFEYQGPPQRVGHGVDHGRNGANGTNGPNGANGANGTNGTSGLVSKAGSMQCIFRLDNDEELLAFLARLEGAKRTAAPLVPAGSDIVLIAPAVAAEFCNTAVVFEDQAQGADRSAPDPMQHDVSVMVTRTAAGRISARLSYWSATMDGSMAKSVLGTFTHVLTDVLTFPGVRVGEVEVCSYDDRSFLRQFTSEVSPVESVCVHDLIVQQCRLHPGRIAVSGWDGDLTYGELDDLSLRLAHHLQSLGVVPDSFVFSCFPKSTVAIIARLAVLRAGGAYISIHASNPPAYLESVVTRTASRILMTDPQHVDRFRSYVENVLEVTPAWIRTLPRHSDTVSSAVKPENACLILFTSGSTGEPKGIIQVHQSYSTAVLHYARKLDLGVHTRFMHFDDYAFDISNLELMVPLVLGGCCCVPSPMVTISDLVNNVNVLRGNTGFLTPTVAIKLDPARVPGLKTLCIGGEPMPKTMVQKWRASGTKLVNQYGMGEVAICCALNDDVQPHQSDRVGRPASGAIWLIDPASPDRLMPVGAVGELLMEGPHLSHGYLDRISRRTEAVFLDRPPSWMAEMHPHRTGSRLYRCGDLGRLHHDGTIQYIGRKDTMLKLDGCRIEAGVVEYSARQCLGPRDAFVVDLLGAIDGLSDPQLVAYVYLDDLRGDVGASMPAGEPVLCDATKDARAATRVEEIRAFISQVLPKYMVPSCFILADRIPQTASKKTDRKKLHAVGQAYYLELRKQCVTKILAERLPTTCPY